MRARDIAHEQISTSTTDGHNAPPADPPSPLPAHAPWLMTGDGQRRLECFTHAVDLLIAAKKYAAANQWDVVFGAEDLRTVANALCISADRNGVRQ